MIKLPNTNNNIKLVQDFIDETKKRISLGVDITFTRKATLELNNMMLEFNISLEDIENSILNLTPTNYYRGIDPSGGTDFNVCAFRVFMGNDKIEIYLKYGLEIDGLQILIFSNHLPAYPMNQPFIN
jgi:hypothetical protein